MRREDRRGIALDRAAVDELDEFVALLILVLLQIAHAFDELLRVLDVSGHALEEWLMVLLIQQVVRNTPKLHARPVA